MHPVRQPWLPAVALLVLTLVRAAHAQCEPGWAEGLFPLPGVNGKVHTMFAWDDGDGPAVYVGGEFTIAGGAYATNIARWDGHAWQALGIGVNGPVLALAASSDALYVGGDFDVAGGSAAAGIARWNGAVWDALGEGVNGEVYSMEFYTDGEGEGLYVGGEFSLAGGQAARNLARWDGTGWSAPAGGVSAIVRDLEVYDDGRGGALYAAGDFTFIGSQARSHVARWDGASWESLGEGISGSLFPTVNALAVFDPGDGPRLYAGGDFNQAGGLAAANIASWDGAQWTSVADGLDNEVRDLATIDDGTGGALYAVGEFREAGGEFFGNGVAKWDGASWSAVGFGVNPFAPQGTNAVSALPTPEGDKPMIAGTLMFAGQYRADNIAIFEDDAWRPAGRGIALHEDDGAPRVDSLAVFDDGSGSALYAGGSIDAAGPVPAEVVARWDGQRWRALVGGRDLNGSATALIGHDDGSGPALYAGGPSFPPEFDMAIVRWDGAAWSQVGAGYDLYRVNQLLEHDDGSGPALYVAADGSFDTPSGTQAGIARWDGSQWQSVGGGLDSSASALAVYDDGRGPALYASGRFQQAGGVDAQGIARWDGAAWEALGEGLLWFDYVYALATFDDGSGPALYGAGSIRLAGGQPVRNIARWDGQQWSGVGGGLDGAVYAMAVYDDGSGRALYAGGTFTQAGGVAADGVARWNGLAWEPVDGGVVGKVEAMLAFDDGGGQALFLAGDILDAGGSPSIGLARYGCELAECPADLDGDGALTIFDFLAFQNAFDAGDPVADFDGDGAFTLFDFLAFQNAFDAGCD